LFDWNGNRSKPLPPNAEWNVWRSSLACGEGGRGNGSIYRTPGRALPRRGAPGRTMRGLRASSGQFSAWLISSWGDAKGKRLGRALLSGEGRFGRARGWQRRWCERAHHGDLAWHCHGAVPVRPPTWTGRRPLAWRCVRGKCSGRRISGKTGRCRASTQMAPSWRIEESITVLPFIFAL
jgi:hypothetical protein